MFVDVVSFALSTWGIGLKQKGRSTEYYGPCPFCGQARKDGFLVWQEGNGRFYCRKCGISGFLDNLEGAAKLSPEEQKKMMAEAKRRELARERKEALAQRVINRNIDYLTYHRALKAFPKGIAWWRAKGITLESIRQYKLGYCERCPTDRERRESYTIPVFHKGKLQNIRHRIKTEDNSNGNKYRPHRPDLGRQLFNADLLFDPSPPKEVIIVEGCIKSIVLMQQGLANVGIMGSNSFDVQWLEWLKGFVVYVALDPDATKPRIERRNGKKPLTPPAYRLAFLLARAGIETKIVELPDKPDDLFVIYGWSVDNFAPYLRYAPRVQPRS